MSTGSRWHEAVHRFSTGRKWLEGEQRAAADLDFEKQPVAGQRLAADDVAQLEGEAFERRQRAGFLVQMAKVEAPAIALPTAMLAHDAVEPAFEAAGQIEVSPVDGQHERVVEHSLVEPVGQDHLDAVRATVTVGALLPLVDPGEAMTAALGGLADRRADRSGLEPVERGLQALVVAQARAAADEAQDFVGCGRHQARGAQACVARLNDLAGRPDQDVGIPDGCHAVIGHGLDANRHVAGDEIDRRDAMGFREGEKRIGHEILCVSWREVTGERPKQVELSALR